MTKCSNCSVFCGSLSFVTVYGVFCPKCFRLLSKEDFKSWLKNGGKKAEVKLGDLKLTGKETRVFVIKEKDVINRDISIN